jgi:ClpP class serine protease
MRGHAWPPLHAPKHDNSKTEERTMNLYTEAKAIAQEAWDETGNLDDALLLAQEAVDGHEITIYYGKAIEFCATHNTDRGEERLEDCGGIAQDGDTFGMIACRVAHATLWMEVEDCLFELEKEQEDAA